MGHVTVLEALHILVPTVHKKIRRYKDRLKIFEIF